MNLSMEIAFDGGKKITAEYKGHRIQTDQTPRAGGEGSAPEPFSLFLASIGTCAGIYVKSFCDQREIQTEGIKLTQNMEFNAETHLVEAITLEITVPADFPKKYIPAMVNAVNLCAVKRHLLNPPKIEVVAKTVEIV